MSNKRTYINLINDFWEADAREQFSAPVTRVYFYLLNRINRNRWEPVFISDVELAEATGTSRRHLPEYREELKAGGFIFFQKTGTGRQAGTFYTVPAETAPKGTVNCAERSSSKDGNCAKRSSKNPETAPKGTVNCAERSSLEPSTPINVSNKTSLRPSTTAEDMRASAPKPTREAVAVVEVIPEEVKEDKNRIEGAAERLIAEKEKAAAQGAEVLKAAFHPYNQGTLESMLMQTKLDPPTYRRLAEEVIADWTERGETHNNWEGTFDIKAATNHLHNTIRIKAEHYRRGQAAPKTRQQSRQDLINASLQHLQAGLADPYGDNNPTIPDPF